MATEIERKFLINLDEVPDLSLVKRRQIVQGYLTSSVEEKDNVVRIRFVSKHDDNIHQTVEKCVITVKSPRQGISCQEFEYEVPLKDAERMLVLCGTRVIRKTRYYIYHADQLIELDIFHGRHSGLVMAEIELPSETTGIIEPKWFGKEVSDNMAYTNSFLAMHNIHI